MPDSRRIPTPLIYRWRRFCNSYVPIVMFLACFLVTLFLWDRQAQMGNGVGAIRTTSTPVFAAVGGMVLPMGETIWKQYDAIEKGDVVCMLDDTLIRARLETLAKTQAQLKTEIEATQAELELETVGYDNDDIRDMLRNRASLSDLRLDLAKLGIEQAEAQAEHTKFQGLLDYLKPFTTSGSERMIGGYDLRTLELDRDVAAARMQEIKKRSAEIETEMKTIQGYADNILKRQQRAYPNKLKESLAKIIQPIEREIEVVEAQMEEIKAESQTLVVRAPVSGIISDITFVPGHAIQPGLPLITIASKDNSLIVSYVRQDQRIQPQVGMKVRVRNRFSAEVPIETMITHVGPQAVLIPQEQLRDPAVPEWGIPVWIARPNQLSAVLPGQTIDISYPNMRSRAAAPREVSVNREASGI